MVSGLSEDSARFPIIGADLSEPSTYLPPYEHKEEVVICPKGEHLLT